MRGQMGSTEGRRSHGILEQKVRRPPPRVP